MDPAYQSFAADDLSGFGFDYRLVVDLELLVFQGMVELIAQEPSSASAFLELRFESAEAAFSRGFSRIECQIATLNQGISTGAMIWT